MNVDPVIVAMDSCVQMLEMAESAEVDPGFAVRMQQVIGEHLQQLPSSDEPELQATLLRPAANVAESDPPVAEYLRRWAGSINLG